MFPNVSHSEIDFSGMSHYMLNLTPVVPGDYRDNVQLNVFMIYKLTTGNQTFLHDFLVILKLSL